MGREAAVRLKPFFGYFGSKWRLARHYPAPLYPFIVEPFAGSAGYSLLHHEGHDVWLCDASPTIVDIWRYLTEATPEEVLGLPDEPSEDLPQAQRDLIGFWLAKAPVKPRAKRTSWVDKYPGSSWWGAKIRERIASQIPYIRRWNVTLGDYRSIPDIVEATWFVDPPYQHHGGSYPCGSRDIDYQQLSEWCRTRKGQVIVCEGEGADWLPFRPFRDGHRGTGASAGIGPAELIWTNDTADRSAEQGLTASPNR